MYTIYKSGACSFRWHLEFGLHRVIALICKVQHLIGEEHIFPNCLFRKGSLVALKTERIAYRNTENIGNHFCRFSRDCRAAEALHSGISRNVIANYHFSKGLVFHCGILRQDKSIFTAQTAFFFNFLNNSCAVLSCDFGHGLFGKPWRHAYDFLQILVYPSLSEYLAEIHGSRTTASYDDSVSKLQQQQLDELLAEAQEYNRKLAEQSDGLDIIDNTESEDKSDPYWQLLNIDDTENLVIAGHNYKRHFGKLTNLRIGDEVALTTMDGTTYRYQVEQVETLDSTAIDEMTAGDYPLTLFTCDYSGQARIAVRCQQTS